MDDLGKEEYKNIFGFTITLEQRMLQIFLVAIVVSASLLSATIGIVLSGKLGVQFKEWGMYLILAPNLITVPAFNLILAQRIDLTRASAYQWVFYEDGSDDAGWVSRLHMLRSRSPDPEALDTIPMVFWAIFFISGGVFAAYVVLEHLSYYHFCVLPVVLLVLGQITYSWNSVIQNHRHYVAAWREVRSMETHNRVRAGL